MTDFGKTYSKQPKIRIDEMGMQATIRFPSPDFGETAPVYDEIQLQQLLRDAGVVYGIHETVLASICKEISFDTDITIATGKEPIAGTAGYFTFHFNQNFSKKPTIREDGTADFYNIKVIEVVHVGEEIATYFPAVHGEKGTTVTGLDVVPEMVRDLPPIGGRGFHRSDDQLHYISDMDGIITYDNNRMIISPVYEIEHDVDMNVGNIDFHGDVVIHGGIKHGITIRATGSVTVHGLVEVCQIYSNKDIYLLGGVKGAGKTSIEAGGSVTAQFVEYANVTCKKDLHADVLMDCNVKCNGKVITTAGKHSAIIGGTVTAIQGISSVHVGNSFGTITRLFVGLDEASMRRMAQLSEEISSLEKNLGRIKEGIANFDLLSEKKGVSYKDDPRRAQLLRARIQEEAQLAEAKHNYDILRALKEAGLDAGIRVYGTIYPGVILRVRDQYVQISQEQKRMEYAPTFEGVHMIPIEGPIPEE